VLPDCHRRTRSEHDAGRGCATPGADADADADADARLF
jgi:hypothetical protein